MGELAAAGEPAELFALDVEPSPQDSKEPIFSISPAGLAAPGHLVRLFMQAGDTVKQAMSEEGAVVGIEAALARAATNGAESADPDKRYHVLPLADLQKLAPNFDFRVYVNHLTARPIETLNVTSPDYVKSVDEMIGSLPIDSWRSYFRWQILSRQIIALPKEFRDGDFASDAQGRRQEPTPRWKQCTAVTDWTPWLRKPKRLTTRWMAIPRAGASFCPSLRARVRAKRSLPRSRASRPTRNQRDRCA
jgi:Peptidase family M13